MPEVYLVCGGNAARFDIATDAVVGSPAPLTSFWGPLGGGFEAGLDAVVNYGNGKAYAFRGSQYVKIDIATNTVESELRSIAEYWTGMQDIGFDTDLDAVVNYGNGTLYFFKAGAFAVYSIENDKVERWDYLSKWQLAPDGSFDSDLDAVVNYGDGFLYFFKADCYVKFSIHEARAVSEVRRIGDYWTGTAAAGVASGLSGSWCTADPAGRTATPVTTPVTTPVQPTPVQPTTPAMSAYRTEILRLLDHFKGHVEGDGVFEQFVSAGALDSARRAAGKAGFVHTTCVDFQSYVFKVAAANAGVTLTTSILGMEAEKRSGAAWHPGTPGTTERPVAGDIFLLYFTDGRVSHTGFIREIIANADGTETWVTVDGGQGTSGKYATDGTTPTQRGQEHIGEIRRVFHPDTGLITGEANQDANQRVLRGWVDVDALVQ